MRYKFFSLALVVGGWLLVAGSTRADLPSVGAVTVDTAGTNPAAQVVQVGTPNVTLVEFTLEATAAEDVWVDGVTLQAERVLDGVATPAEAHDLANLVLFDGTKFWTASGLANDGTITFTFSNFRLAGGGRIVFRVLGTPTALGGTALRLTIPAERVRQWVNVRGVQSGRQLAVTGSVQGNKVQVQGAFLSKPDLVIADFSWSPGSVNISPTPVPLRLSAAIRNDGATSATLPSGFTVNFYWKNMGLPLATWRLPAQQILAPGQSLREENIQSFSDARFGTEAGSFPIFADVDASGLVDEQGEANNVSQKTVNVTGVLTLDTAPPAISALQVSRVTSIDAVASWTTNEAATGLVEFGTSTNFGYARSDFTLQPAHYFALNQLTPGTKYFYRVCSRDAASNETTSEIKEFVTEKIREAESITKFTFNLSTVTPPLATIQPGLGNVPFLKFMSAATGNEDIEVRSIRFRLYRDDPTPFLPVDAGDITAVRLFDGDREIGKVSQFEQSMATFAFLNKEMLVPAGTNRTYTVVADLGGKLKARLLHIDLAHASIRQDVVSRGVKTGVDVFEDGGANGQFMAVGSVNVPLAVGESAVDGRAPVLSADVDGDGLIEEQEARYHTDVRNADTDGDGYPDGLEVRNGYDPRSTCKLETGTLKLAAMNCRSKYLRVALTNLGLKKLPAERSKAWQGLLKKFVYDFESPARLADSLKKK